MLADDAKCASEGTCFVWLLGDDCWVMMNKCASEGTFIVNNKEVIAMLATTSLFLYTV